MKQQPSPRKEELKKGCGKYFESDLEDYMEDKIIGYECNENHLCSTCQARLEGFQKGKLEERRKVRELIDKYARLDEAGDWYIYVYEFKEQLQKEIGGNSK